MKLCLYARQQCKWPDSDCFKDEELRPMFVSAPGLAVKKVWYCQWAGGRLNLPGYLLHLINEGKLKV